MLEKALKQSKPSKYFQKLSSKNRPEIEQALKEGELCVCGTFIHNEDFKIEHDITCKKKAK